MRQNWKSWCRSHYKQNQLVLKLGVSILLVGLGFRLLFSRSTVISDVSPVLDAELKPQDEDFVDPSRNIDQIPLKDTGKRCDLFTGDWIPDRVGPVYNNESCPWIETHQNCMKNGRPDSKYLYWRWKPRDCELPRFNAQKFLEFVRDKTWTLVGDSITRNHVQSLLCVISKVENAVHIYHDKEYRNRRWHFPSYNFTVSVLWSPYLAKAAIFEDYNGVSTSEVKLHLDVLDKTWIEPFQSSDYVVFSSGKWFVKTAIYYENNEILGCHSCDVSKNLTNMEMNFAYRKVLKSVFRFIVNSKHKGMIFYRTSTPDHFEGGEWSSGGTCKREEPAKEGDFELKEFNRILREIELEEFEKAEAEASAKGVKLKLLDVTGLSLLRPDGHPGPYRHFYPFAKDKNAKVQYDCLHWCLPGPIDYWNDLLMELVVNG